MQKISLIMFFLISILASLSQAQSPPVPDWPMEVKEIKVLSSADGSLQPSLFYTPDVEDDSKIPLLVALHTWSGNYTQRESRVYAEWCIANNWAFIHPNYRGPNKTPESGGSDLVVADVRDAVNHMIENQAIDLTRIYLIGGSGGGYNALQVAAKFPEPWAAVSVWVPITNLEDWYFENKKAGRRYANDIINVTGGTPNESAAIDQEYFNRSPINWLKNARHISIDIGAGIFDGHRGSVPINHSLLAFNKLAFEKDKLSKEEISFFVDSASVPSSLFLDIKDDSYPENKPPLFRRSSRKVRLTIFDGGHDTLYETGLIWLSEQRKGKFPVY